MYVSLLGQIIKGVLLQPNLKDLKTSGEIVNGVEIRFDGVEGTLS
jgi:hypothetical protein